MLAIVRPLRRRPLKKNSAAISERLASQLDQLLDFNILCFTPTCWKRAAVLHRYLALNGIETRVVFGVRQELKEPLAGHAWLEINGIPILEANQPEYVVTYTYPPESKDEVGRQKAERIITQTE